MTEKQHLSEEDIQRYVHRTMGPAELLLFDAHMSECQPCLNKIADRTTVRASVAAFLAEDAEYLDDHLTYEQLEQYVDGGGDAVDLEIASVHMEVCGICSQQLSDLRQVSETLQIEPTPLLAAILPADLSSTATFWHRFTASSFLKFAVPALAAVILGVGIWTLWFLTLTPPPNIAEVIDPVANTPITGNTDTGNVPTPDGAANANSSQILPPISLADGGTRVEIDADGNLKGLNAPQFERRVKAALTAQTFEISAAAKELRSNSSVLMGDNQPGASFALTTPVGKIVQTDRPQFKWRPLEGADSYVVTVFDRNFNKVAASPALRQPAWTVGTPLKRGSVFQWQVTAIKDGQEVKSPVRPAPAAMFKVLDAAAASDIEAAKRQAGNSRLLLGIVYAKAGLLDEAEREFRALVQQNPRSDLARRLLNRVRAAR